MKQAEIIGKITFILSLLTYIFILLNWTFGYMFIICLSISYSFAIFISNSGDGC